MLLLSWPFALFVAVGASCIVSGYANKTIGTLGLIVGPLVGIGVFLIMIAINQVIKNKAHI